MTAASAKARTGIPLSDAFTTLRTVTALFAQVTSWKKNQFVITNNVMLLKTPDVRVSFTADARQAAIDTS